MQGIAAAILRIVLVMSEMCVKKGIRAGRQYAQKSPGGQGHADEEGDEEIAQEESGRLQPCAVCSLRLL